jgi:hypothetical protein
LSTGPWGSLLLWVASVPCHEDIIIYLS